MQIIAIHCVLAARSKKCAVWPLRQYQKAVNRNKNAEHAVPAVIDEIVLHRQQQVKADHHAVIVAAAAIDEGHEFAQCGK